MTPALLGTVPFDLMGLAEDPIELFLLAHPKPTSGEVADFLRPYGDRATMAQTLIARGVDTKTISSALSWLEAGDKVRFNWSKTVGVLSLASAAVSAYHGYKRNDSIPWAIWWFFAGSVFPVFTPVIALAQGYGKSKKS